MATMYDSVSGHVAGEGPEPWKVGKNCQEWVCALLDVGGMWCSSVFLVNILRHTDTDTMHSQVSVLFVHWKVRSNLDIT